MQEHVPALVFTVRGRLYSLPQDGGAALLPWLQRFDSPGSVPGVPNWMLGLLSVQGTVQAIADLGAFLGFGVSTPSDESRLIFIEHGDLRVGLLVDSASGIRYFDSMNFTGYSADEPLVAGRASFNGQEVRVLDGIALLYSLAESLGAPSIGRA